MTLNLANWLTGLIINAMGEFKLFVECTVLLANSTSDSALLSPPMDGDVYVHLVRGSETEKDYNASTFLFPLGTCCAYGVGFGNDQTQ